jgi:hypothetical protein
VGHASRSNGLFQVEASRARVSQSDLKTDGGATRMVHVVLSRRLHRGQVKNGRVDATGCVGPCYSCFIVFFVLDHRGIVVFLLFYLGL